MHRLPPRMVGVMLLAASVGTTLCHRVVYDAARHGPAQLAEFALGLATFLLASTGVLLLIHGARLFDGCLAGASAAAECGEIFDTRKGVALMQARHAIAESRKLQSADF